MCEGFQVVLEKVRKMRDTLSPEALVNSRVRISSTCANLQAISISERGHERAISHGILSDPTFRDLYVGMWPRELPSEESKVSR